MEKLSLATISAVVGIIVAWLSIIGFILKPLENRMDTARDNLIRALAERDARMDYIQRQIDELEQERKQR